jgi:4-amino-4-deoxy-L-arabinose transferase-like glycosyltransferase
MRKLGQGRLLFVIILATVALTIGSGLGSASRLSYHEAIVAQGAREMLSPKGNWLVPTIGDVPWLEKPPLAHWLVAIVGGVTGQVNELAARIPSAIAALGLALAVATLARTRFGPRIGLLSGLIQATTSWFVMRGRLADADMLLAALVAGVMVSLDRLRDRSHESSRIWMCIFFSCLGATSLAKGIGFGAVFVLAIVTLIVAWDHDAHLLRRVLWPTGCLVSLSMALIWPLAVVARFPDAIQLWVGHVTDRFAERTTTNFDGDPTWLFLLAPLFLALPWTPLSLFGMSRSISRGISSSGRFGLDRLLWAWAIVPIALLSMATVKNDHYLIHAMAPWSIWAARGLARLGIRLKARRKWSWARVQTISIGLISLAAITWAIGIGVLGARFDHRGREWAWYRSLQSRLKPDDKMILIYDWDEPELFDRLPYPTPYGPIPHDLAVRLFYLNRPRDKQPSWQSGTENIAVENSALFLIGRERDLPNLRAIADLNILDRSPNIGRTDREYLLIHMAPQKPNSRDRIAGLLGNQ